jgi:hypothetical protein
VSEHFDKWNTKYFQVGTFVRRMVMFLSHKFFQMPYTHFFGYLHCTVRPQEHLCIWEWDEKQVDLYNKRRVTKDDIAKSKFKFYGKLVPMSTERDFLKEMAKDDEDF